MQTPPPIRRRTISLLCAGALLAASLPPPAQAAPRLSLIRDAEIESLLRAYVRPIFKVAGLHARAVKVHLVNNNAINAFVAGGQRIFVFTGMILEARTPNELTGVLAHEAAHIAAGHLVRRGIAVENMTVAAILTMLAAAGAVAAAGATGQGDLAEGGVGVMMGGQSMLRRGLLAYMRGQEAAADQAAARYLARAGQSGRGMLDLFRRMHQRQRLSLRGVDPYLLTHPLPRQRLANLERIVRQSPHYKKADPAALLLRHRLAQAKIVGYTMGQRGVGRRFARQRNSLPARYARAIALFRRGNLRASLPLIDSLIRAKPRYAYFHELKGLALLENGRARAAVAPLRQAVRLSGGNALIRMALAEAMLASGDRTLTAAALKELRRAAVRERESPRLHYLLARAHAALGDLLRAELETAEAALLNGEKRLAARKAAGVLRRAKKGSPPALRAHDILRAARRK